MPVESTPPEAQAISIAPGHRQTAIVGMQHYMTQADLEALVVGDEVDLIREPGNRYDSNAIGAHRFGQQVGFVPAAVAKAIAPLLDAGWRGRGEVTGFQPGSEPRYWRIGLRIKLWPPATPPAEGATS